MLVVQGVSKYFGRLQALDAVELAVEGGEVFGIAGPNGAGKSTLFNIIAGYYPPSAGIILFQGRDITRLNANRICRLGIARTFQIPQTFPTLSVYDNIRVGATFGGGARGIDRRRRIDETIEFLGLQPYRSTPAANLDLYTTKLVMLGAALATGCRLLMLDEPLAGLAMNEMADFLQVVRTINREGQVTILMIEHLLDHLIEVSDRILVLDNGRVIYVGPPTEVRNDPEVIKVYLGEAEDEEWL